MKTYNYILKGGLSFIFLLFFFVSYSQAPEGYYTDAEGRSGDELKTALYNIIKGHVEYSYTSSSTDTWDILKEADRDPNNPQNVLGIYSAFSMDGDAEYNNGQGWNREHVWAKSRGDFGTSRGAGTDCHHLRAADISTNSARNNRTFAECDEPYVDQSGQYNGATGSFTSSSEFVWKPREEVKGDVARMIFYMAVRYEGENGEPDLELVDYIVDASDKSPVHGRLSDLLQWHEEDPVDDEERRRNDVVYSYQENRNPFIDNPQYVMAIWGDDTTEPVEINITSNPITSVTVNEEYNYTITATGGENELEFTATEIPTWLNLTDNGDGTADLNGTPTETDEGNHDVTIEVTDNVTTETQSFIINVNGVDEDPNDLPEISIISPTDNDSFIEGEVITIEADASDSDGTITKVVFYEGTNELGEATNEPYTIDWGNAEKGEYLLSAVAYDNDNGSTQSETVRILVEDEAQEGGEMISSINLETTETSNGYTATATVSIESESIAITDVYVEVAWYNSDSSYFDRKVLYTDENGATFVSDPLDEEDFYIEILSANKENYEWDKENSIYKSSITTFVTSNDQLVSNEIGSFFYPNPFDSAGNLEINVSQYSELHLSIYDAKGRQVRNDVYELYKGGNTLSIGNDLGSGIYSVQLRIGEKVEAFKIMKQ